MPVFYAIVLGLALNVSGLQLPSFLWVPLEHVSQAMVAIGLLSLGAQIAEADINMVRLSVILSCISRLFLSPVIALVLIFLFSIEGLMAKVLLISSASPTARNSAVLALEYDTEPAFAAQAVLISTIASGFTISVVIYVAQVLF